MLNSRDGTKERPQDLVVAKPQGKTDKNSNPNFTTNGQLKDSRSRYDKGMELYKSGKVSIGANGLFKVSGYYEADTEKMTCTCPDYRTRKESCKHLFAAMLFVKNHSKRTIEHLEERDPDEKVPYGWADTTEFRKPAEPKPAVESKQPPEKSAEAHSKDFDKQAVITRLATINSAIEALKTHRKPIEYGDIVSLAAQLETWALGN